MNDTERGHLPPLVTERLQLTPITLADVPALRAHWNHPWVRQHLFDGEEVSVQRAAEIAEREMQRAHDERAGVWRIDLLTERGLIGTAGLVRMRPDSPLEMLWTLEPRHWHRGHANEAVRAVLAFNDLGLRRVHAGIDAANLRSLRLAQRLGFRPDDMSPLAAVRSFVLEQPQWKTVRAIWWAIDRLNTAAP